MFFLTFKIANHQHVFPLKLFLSGDIEINPGPQLNVKHLKNLSRKTIWSLKFFHLNAQSLPKKRTKIKNLIKDYGANTIFRSFRDLIKNQR